MVFGVSIDPLDSHRAFIEKYGLPFPLLSDEDGKIVRAYGVWVEKNLYGNEVDGHRTVHVRHRTGQGRIEAIFRRVKPDEHAEQVLAVLKDVTRLAWTAKTSFLHLFERLEGFVGKLPGSLQKPILQEITPLKDLFLRQRAPRLVLTGDPAAGSAGLFNAIFSAPVAPFAQAAAADAVPPAVRLAGFFPRGPGRAAPARRARSPRPARRWPTPPRPR